jgi:hypothetical protein
MPRVTLPFTNGFYVADSLPLSAQQCQNLYVAKAEAGGLSEEVLYATPGIEQAGTTGGLPSDANRGGAVFNDVLYVVNGPTLYRVAADGAETDLGAIAGTGRVWLLSNSTQLLVLVPGDPSTGYIFTTGPDSLATISDTDFKANGEPQAACYVDGYFVFTTDEKKFIISALNDGTSYNALDFGSAESSPDRVVLPFVFKNQLFIAGDQTIEGFTNIGGADFPFRRSGLFLDQGVLAPFSVVRTPGVVYFMGAGVNEGPAIWGMAGNEPERVSTQAIDAILDRLSDDELRDVFGLQYAAGGHYFVAFALPDVTLVFDPTTGKWHERYSRVTNVDLTVEDVRWRVNSIMKVYGQLYAGDSQDGRIGIIDNDVYTAYGETIFRSFATMPFQDNMKPFTLPYLELTVESGVGNAAAPDPQVRLDISRDGGKTWLPERRRSMGKLGEWMRRAVWRRNGRSARFDVYRFSIAEPVKVAILQLTADIRPGADRG